MPGGDGNRDGARSGNAAATPAVRAGIGDADALTAADGAGRAGHELTEDRLLGAADLASAIAGRADGRLLAVAHARSIAALADLEAGDLDVLLRAEDRFLELDGQRDLDIRAA